MFKVFDKCCKQCLTTSRRIVGEQRKDEIINGCLAGGTHFICHKASMADKDICCAGFFHKYKNQVPKLQIFERLGLVVKVKQDD